MIKGDKILFLIVLALTTFGFLALASASLGLALDETKTSLSTPLRQFILGIFGGGLLFLITNNIRFQFWKERALLIFILAIILMLFVSFTPFGVSFGGAKRWLIFGPLSFQPAEFLKLGFLVYLCSWLYSRKKEISTLEFGLLPFCFLTGVVAFLLFIQKDLSTFLVIAAAAGFLFFIAGGRIKQIGILLIIAIILVLGAIKFEPYRFSRLLVFWNPQYDIQGAGFQANQALIAVGSGGLFGRGFGMSLQKFNNYLPEPTSDAIFAVIAEEFGFVGAGFLVLLFLALIWRTFYLVNRVSEQFPRLFGFGIVILISLQAFMNIGGIIGLLPLMGLPLPFISQGGTALAMNLAEIGILLNITKYAR